MAICSGIEKNATICRISATMIMRIPTPNMKVAAPIRYSNPVVWNIPMLSLVPIVS